MTLVVGTAGHIDHGKSTLLRALTGIDPDRLPEERRRGMTIDVGYAHLDLPDGGALDFVDVPGHDRLVGNMLVGAGEIDAALLVVAADDGPRAQTIEHLELVDGLGIAVGLAVVTKLDLVEVGRRREVTEAVAGLLGRTSLRGATVLEVSAATGEGIEVLRAALVQLALRAVPTSPGEAGPRLAVDRAFSVRGRGTVVTGSLRGGPIERGMSLRLWPSGRAIRAREIQVHGQAVETAGPGRVAVNVAGIDLADVGRGMVLAADGAVQVSDRLLVAVRAPAGLAEGDPRLPRDRERLRLHVATEGVDVVVGRGPRDTIDLPNGEATATLRLDRPIAVAEGDRFVLRRPSPGGTAAGGRVLDCAPPSRASRRRLNPDRIAAAALAAGPRERDAALLELHGFRLVGGEPRLAADLEQVLSRRAVQLLGERPSLAELRLDLARDLRRRATVSPDDALDAAGSVVDRLVGAGRLVRDGERVRDPGSAPRSADPALVAAMDRLEAALDVPAPPSLSAAAAAAGCSADGIRTLEAAGRIVRVDADLAWSAATHGRLAAKAVAMAATAPLTPAALRDATGTSRKYVMALLEDLDRRGWLRRTPDGHVPGPRAPAPAEAASDATEARVG